MSRDFENIKTRMLEVDNRLAILRRDFFDVIDSTATSVRSLQNTVNRLRANNKKEREPDLYERVVDHILPPKKPGIIRGGEITTR